MELRNAGALLDTALIVVVRRLGTQNAGLFEVFGHREDRIGVGEIHHTDRVRVGNIFAWRPFSDEHGRVDRVVIVTQKAEVYVEVANQVGKHPFTDRGMARPRWPPSTRRPPP